MASIWSQFQELIFQVLRIIQGAVGDWGLAIIVLTIFVRLLLMPLTVKQTKSMYELQRIQPKIKELQKKYADDKEKLQEETLKYYQENKVNPFGGCLPLLLQMPLLFALYQVLGGTADKPGLLIRYLAENDMVGRFYFLISDISMTPNTVFAEQGILAAVPYAILVVIFGLSIWLPQALMPGEKQQKMMGMYMAVLMLFFGWSAPAGVLLYWDLSSIWGIAQQQIITSMVKRQNPEDTVAEALDVSETRPKGPSNKKDTKKKAQG